MFITVIQAFEVHEEDKEEVVLEVQEMVKRRRPFPPLRVALFIVFLVEMSLLFPSLDGGGLSIRAPSNLLCTLSRVSHGSLVWDLFFSSFLGVLAELCRRWGTIHPYHIISPSDQLG